MARRPGRSWDLRISGHTIDKTRRATVVAAPEPNQVENPEQVATSDAAEIDLTDVNLITTRIVVGILFSFILALPVYQYHSYLHKLIMGAEGGASGSGADMLQDM